MESQPINAQVADFYDQLDTLYCDSSALDVHHGLWLHGNESRDEAKRCLTMWVATELALQQGEHCVDIGSGYGQMAREIALIRNVSVIAVTNSPLQHRRALSEGKDIRVEYRLGDWCGNELQSGRFDAAWAVESLEHISNLDSALRECRRVLRDDGRLIVLSWLAGDCVNRWQKRFLVKPLTADNRLAELRTLAEFREALRRSGFGQLSICDLTSQVSRTWMPTTKGILRQLGYRAKDMNLHPGIRSSTTRIALAYLSGAMRYVSISGVAKVERPANESD